MHGEGPTDDRDLGTLLGLLDHVVPTVSAGDVIARARRRGSAKVRMLRRVAGVVVGLGAIAGAAYGAPGSPVRAWVVGLAQEMGWIEGPLGSAPPSQAGTASAEAGLSLVPGERLVIRFEGEGAAGYVSLSVGDGSEVAVRSTSAGTRFVSEPDRLLVDHRTADTVQVSLPLSAVRLEIQVAGRTVLVQEGSTVTTSVPADVEGRWLIPLGFARP